MIRLKDILNELEFASQKEFDAYSKNHELRKSTKVTIAGRLTTAGLASLRRGLPDKPAGTKVFGDKEKIKPITDKKTDDKIYDFVSDWVISSLDDTEKRQTLLSKIENTEIPKEYKEVPSDYLYRARRKGTQSDQKYLSYSYTIQGAERMKGWLKKIFGTKDNELEIIKIPVSKANIVISIPAFLKATKKSSGKKFDALWKNETEVIVKQN